MLVVMAAAGVGVLRFGVSAAVAGRRERKMAWGWLCL
jgi:hypothetical protein